jgi:hypothetical protein
MGGLVTRSYFQNISSYSYKNDVNHLVMIAPPSYGSAASTGITQNWKVNYLTWWSSLIGIFLGDTYSKVEDNRIGYTGASNSPIYKQMSVASSLFESFNKNKVLEKSIVIIGNQDYTDFSSFESFMCSILDDGAHAEGKIGEHDCLVSIASSSLLNKNVTLSIISNKNHATEKNNLLDYSNLIISFLNDDSDLILASNSYAYYNPKTGYKKNFNYNEGSVQFKLIENNSIWNKNSNDNLEIERISTKEKFKLTRNMDSKNYFHFNRESGKIDSFYTIPKGEYRLIIPEKQDHQLFHFIIKPMETNLIEINLDNLCNVNLTNTSWSEWTNISCLKMDKMNQSRFLTQYDSNICGKISNKTIIEYRLNQICDFCKPNIYGPFYTEWTSCNNVINMNRIKYYIDLNFNSCCLITNKDSDCVLIKNLTYQNITEIQFCGSPIIHNPKEGEIMSNRKVLINVSTGIVVNSIKYQLDGKISRNGQPLYIDICNNKDCSHIEKYLPLTDGNHTLGIVTINKDNRQFEDSVNFLIDSKSPQISTTKPQSRKYTNGNDFYIKYSEENCKNLKILINGNQVFIKLCDSGKNVEWIIPLNISKYNGQEVEYKFIIADIANNTDESRLVKVKVDTIAPEIKNFKALVIDRNVYFNMTILNEDKNSFNRVEYLDGFEGTKARWKNLCTSLKNNNCYKKVSFVKGDHNLTIRASDKAGNSVQKQISFNIS